MKKIDENISIIDADSIIYVIGYELADMPLEPLGAIKLDEFITSILIANNSKYYHGFFGDKGGRNFRKDIAITKKYKGQRPPKPEWHEFWAPILKKRMKDHWGFEPCLNIEADDACAIAAKKYRGKYNKVIVASPDKDLLQIPDTWFYDYTKGTNLFCSASVSIEKYCYQLIIGDSTDNIPGCFGAGESAAEKVIAPIVNKGLGFAEAIEVIKNFYVEWNTITLRTKQGKKQEKKYLDDYKAANGIKRLLAKVKSVALKDFEIDVSMLLTVEESLILFEEQFKLITLINTEEEAAEHDFVLGEPIKDKSIDWSSINVFEAEMEMMPEEQDFDFEDDL
jgi:5'-3' exonuclease